MRRPNRFVIAIALAAAAVAIPGCGSGGDGAESRDELALSAGDICKQATGKTDRIVADWDFGAPRDASGADLYLEQQRQVLLDHDVALLGATVARLEALEPDEEARTELKDFLAAQRNYQDQVGDLADFQARVAAERDFAARELRKRFGDGYVEDRDRAEKAAVAASRTTLGGKAGRYCPPKLPSLAVFTFPTTEQAYLSRLRGDYKGTVRQFGPGKVRASYPAKVSLATLVRNRVGGFVEYPSFPCEGKWVFLGLKGRRFYYREMIEKGSKICVVASTVSVRVVGDKLDFRWKSDSGAVDVVGTLRRSGT